MTLLIYILIGIFVLRTLIFIVGVAMELSKDKKIIKPNNLPFVSAIVPARNEEKHIANCIKSISENDYPINKYEIIAINDRSTDSTGEILDSLKEQIPNLQVIHNDNEKAIKNLQGKPGALQLGINSANGEIIMMTDADCIVGKKWIYLNSICYNNPNLGMTAACTNVLNNNFFSSLQSVEWIYLHTMAVAGIGLNAPLSCFGNNISFSKAVLDKIGAYSAVNFSVTEDLAMMMHIFNNGYDIRFLSNFDSTVNTQPNKTFKEYFNQHHRWVIGGLGLGAKAVLYVLTTIAIWLAIILPIFTGDYILSLIAILTRAICDIVLILPTLNRLNRRNLIPYLIPSFLFINFMELLAPFMTLKKNVKWKNQTFKTRKKEI